MLLEDACRRLASAGLQARGAFHPSPPDEVPPLAGRKPVGTLVLAGNAGSRMWAAFEQWHCSTADPLDRWSRHVLTGLADRLGAVAYFPFTRPYLPFQRWARRAEPCHPSPLGLYIHPDYGLWHGYRGALGFAGRLQLPPPDLRPNPCEACRARPCLDACPVEAFADAAYDVRRCVARLRTRSGRDCLELGCRARRACPVGRDYTYEPAQAGFHMRAFVRNHSPGSPR